MMRRTLRPAIGIIVLAALPSILFAQGAADSVLAPRRHPLDALRIVAKIPLAKSPDWIALGFGSVWVVNYAPDRVSRIDPGTGRVLADIPLGPNGCLGIVIAAARVWVATCGDGVINEIDPRSNAVVRRIPAPIKPGREGAFAFAAGSFWVPANSSDSSSSQVARIDAKSGRLVTTVAVGRRSDEVIAGFGAVWAASSETDTVYRIDPSRNVVAAKIGVGPSPKFMAAGEGAIWVQNRTDGSVSRIDPGRNREIARIEASAPTPWGDIATGNGAVWLSVNGKPVTRIDPRTNQVTHQFVGGDGADAIRFGAGALWVADHKHGELWRIDAGLLPSRASAVTTTPGHAWSAADLDALSHRLDSLRQAARIPGLSVALIESGRVVLSRGFGFANLERGVPATDTTPYNIASVSKPLSAVVAMRLVELGKLDLDRRMTSFAGFAEFCQEVHGGGGIFFGDFDCGAETLTLRRVMSMSGNGVPGTRFLYNPPAYSWASRPMAEVTGQTFSSLVAQYVLAPAGMSHSARTNRRLPLAAQLAAALATPYHLDSAGRAVASEPPPPQGDGAAGGVISTAADLARFDLALDAGTLISAPSRAAMWTPTVGPDGSPFPYGLGWFVRTVRGERLVWHTGLWEGAYSALYLKIPARGVTLILLANSDAVQYPTALDAATIENSPFAMALLDALPR